MFDRKGERRKGLRNYYALGLLLQYKAQPTTSHLGSVNSRTLYSLASLGLYSVTDEEYRGEGREYNDAPAGQGVRGALGA